MASALASTKRTPAADTDLQIEAHYDSFFDFWYNHRPSVNGKPVHFESWFEFFFHGRF